MSFSEVGRKSLKNEKERGLLTFLIALLMACALFIPYMIIGKGYFIFYGDFNVQQIPFYQECHRAIREGSLAWSFTTDLGANFIGSYSFYLLGSPFFWITLLFPNSFVPYLMGPLLILKFACAAFTAYLYIRRFTKTPRAAMLGGLLYAFSGFSIYNIFFNHFHEAIIVFPLLLLAMEMLITENRRGVFAFAVALCATVNYFFFFGMAVFCVIYYFVKLCLGAYKFKFTRFLALVFEAVLGVALSMMLLYPSILAIIGNSRVSNFLLGWNALLYGKEQIYLNVLQCFFFPPDLPARPVFFPNADVKWSSLGGWLPLFGMTGVITWLSEKKKTWIRRLIIICIFMALVPVLNSVFYAFNSAYYARWFYMPILIMALATVSVCEDKEVNLVGGFKWSVAITVISALVIGFYPQKDAEGNLIFGLYTYDEDGMYIARYWITVIIAVISLLLLCTFIYFFAKNRKAFIRASIIAVCIISVAYGSIFVGMGQSHSYNIEDVMIDRLIEGNVNLDGDKDTYRIDVYDGVDNTGMYLGYSTMNAFHSIVPSGIMDFYKYVGIERNVGSRAGTDYPALRPLFSVKYLINRKGSKSFLSDIGEPLMPGYEYIKTSGGYYVYENKNFIPYGFSYEYAMNNTFCDAYDNQSRSRLMLKAMLLSDEDMKKYSNYIKDINIAKEEWQNSRGVITEQQEITAPGVISEQELLPESTESVVENTPAPESSVSFALTDEEMLSDCRTLAANAASSFKTGNGTFTAKVKRDKKSLVFFSVPYDEGWSATVNGKKAEIIKANVGFMAVAVEEGESTVCFEYKTPGLAVGIIISVAALGILVIYSVTANLVIKRKRMKELYPEGDELVSLWEIDEDKQETEKAEEEESDDGILSGLGNIDAMIPQLSDDEKAKGFKIDKNVFDD